MARWLKLPLLVTLLALGFISAKPAKAQSAALERPSTMTLSIKGSITSDLLPKVRKAVSQLSGDPIPAGLIVLLDSPGGDGLVAIEVGRLLRQANAHVFVTGKCASACVFIFMGGVVRQAADQALGIHRARLTRIDPKTKKRIDVDHQRDPKAQKRLRDSDEQIRQYVQEMGILAQFSAAMNEVPPEKMRWLSRLEGKNLGVIGFHADYLKTRKAYVAKQLGTDPRDVERFTERVLPRCIDEANRKGGDFVRCYRLALS
jgi:ATP-dependent protease ClpP protease subunit